MADEEDNMDLQLQEEVRVRAGEVAALLGRKDLQGALAAALKNPPVGAKAAEIKVNIS